MKKYDIENIPVYNLDENIGSISANGLFDKILNNPELKGNLVETVMEKPYPMVSFDMPVERLSSYISKETGAVISKDDSGSLHIVTKYDIIQSLSK